MIKNRLLPLVAVALVMLVAACHSDKSEVRRVAQHYLDATGRYDVPEACLYCTDETADGLRLVDSTLLRKVPPEAIAHNMPADIDISAVEFTSDTSALVLFHKKTPASEFDDTLAMLLRDGRWLAHKPLKNNIVIQ